MGVQADLLHDIGKGGHTDEALKHVQVLEPEVRTIMKFQCPMASRIVSSVISVSKGMMKFPPPFPLAQLSRYCTWFTYDGKNLLAVLVDVAMQCMACAPGSVSYNGKNSGRPVP